MKGLHGIIFSYEKHNSLRELTANRMPASVPFAGRYRIIDFVLSSMVNAGITDVGVVMGGSYQSLLDHLGSGKDWDLSRKHGGLRLLPPFSYEETGGVRAFRGKMEALAGVRSYLEGVRQSHVVLADSDLIVNIPLQEVYQAHLDSGADITAVCTSSVDGPDDVTYFRLDGEGRITETLYPLNDPTGCYRSLEMYILSKDLLLELVDECMSHDLCSFRGAVLQAKAGALNIRSLVADGCTIEGTVENSILFRGVSVEKGAEIKNCILMQDTAVHRDAVLHQVVADKNVEIMASRTLMGHEGYPMVISKGSKV